MSGAEPGIDKVYPMTELSEMLAECDFVCMATPWTKETDKLLKYEHFAAMKPTAVFINVGRGKCVDEAGLFQALREGLIAGVSLDVTESEPVKDNWEGWADDPALEGKVLMSCHSCDHTADMSVQSAKNMAKQMARFTRGVPLTQVAQGDAVTLHFH